MSDNWRINSKGDLAKSGSATGKTSGPMGTGKATQVPGKSGTLGVNDSSDEQFSREQELQALKKKYEDIIKKGRSWNKHVAADMLEHWLQGSGTQKRLKCEWLRGFSAITDAEETNRKRFEEKTLAGAIKNLGKGKTLEAQGYWDRKLTAGKFDELYYASGTSIITSRGKFKLEKDHDGWITITGTVEHHWWDPYDWHPGLVAFIPGFGSVEDGDAAKLEAAGYGKPFGMYSFWYQALAGKYGVDKGFAYFDSQTFQWGTVNCGRAPAGAAGQWSRDHDAVTDSHGKALPGLSETTPGPGTVSTPKVPPNGRNRDGWR